METRDGDLEQRIAGIAALDEPARRDLYRYVVDQGRHVSRDEAAEAAGISRALAAFHLDRLVEEGLLEARFRRLSGKRGPGAGRPSKLYSRAEREIQVCLPPRQYELAARLFARTLDSLESPAAAALLGKVARDFGQSMGAQARNEAGAEQRASLDAARDVLAAQGYEPVQQADGEIRLRNCPFHLLAADHRPLVCGMNLSLMQGVIDGLRTDGIEAVLDPLPGLCCVVLRPGITLDKG